MPTSNSTTKSKNLLNLKWSQINSNLFDNPAFHSRGLNQNGGRKQSHPPIWSQFYFAPHVPPAPTTTLTSIKIKLKPSILVNCTSLHTAACWASRCKVQIPPIPQKQFHTLLAYVHIYQPKKEPRVTNRRKYSARFAGASPLGLRGHNNELMYKSGESDDCKLLSQIADSGAELRFCSA